MTHGSAIDLQRSSQRDDGAAEIKPATRTRVDFGLALKASKRKPPRRLIDTGGLARGDRITHRFPISSVDEIDEQLKQWVKIAYDLDAVRS